MHGFDSRRLPTDLVRFQVGGNRISHTSGRISRSYGVRYSIGDNWYNNTYSSSFYRSGVAQGGRSDRAMDQSAALAIGSAIATGAAVRRGRA